MNIIKGGINAPSGYKSAGAHVGIKKNKKDLALIYSPIPAIAAGAFTTNVVRAASVDWNVNILNNLKNKIRGIVINSGNANACTGIQGIKDNEAMAEHFSEIVNAHKEEILVCSTGVIGVPLNMDIVLEGISQTANKLCDMPEDANLAAQAIITTDTFTKEVAVTIEIDNKIVTIGAMAKGSGMIHPNMATLLSFVTTDVSITKDLLDAAVFYVVQSSYNMISVDRDTSTNDSFIVLANGLAGNGIISSKDDNYYKFRDALLYVNVELAKSIARDGEGATKLLEVSVLGANSIDDARKLAKSVISSNLVKTAFFGEDANWGRLLAALGYSGVQFDPLLVDISIKSSGGAVLLMEKGTPIVFDEILAKQILSDNEIFIYCNLNSGNCSATAWGCDLTYDYVKINGEYRT